MKKIIYILLAVILVLALVSLAATTFIFPYNGNNPPSADDFGFSEEGVQEVVDANNAFAFDLYSELIKSEDGNIFYSPYSMSSALAMTFEGANGKTAEEMQSVFHFPAKEVLRPNFAAIYNDLNIGNKDYSLKTGNALWVQQDYPFLDSYLTLVDNRYGGKAANLDFVDDTEHSRVTINTFIEDQTNNKIKDLIPEGILSSDTRLVLTNAVYFKGDWDYAFDTSDTHDSLFHVDSTTSVTTPMMNMRPKEKEFNYLETEKLQVLELSYKGDDVSMLILLPKQMESYNFETNERIFSNYTLDDIDFSSGRLNEYKSQMAMVEMSYISLPSFEFDSKYFMKEALINLGMPLAFSAGADFSGMTGSQELFIGSVIHQAYIKVDEKGTTAAAATAVMMVIMSMPMSTNSFEANHPFVFVIQEKETGNILFVGRVTDPMSTK